MCIFTVKSFLTECTDKTKFDLLTLTQPGNIVILLLFSKLDTTVIPKKLMNL